MSIRPISLSKWFQLKKYSTKLWKTFSYTLHQSWSPVERANKQIFKGGLNFIVFPNIELSHRNLFIRIFYAWLQLVPQVFEIAVNKHFICKVNTKGGGEKIIYIIFAIVIDTRIYQTDVNLTNCQKKYQLCSINY